MKRQEILWYPLLGSLVIPFDVWTFLSEAFCWTLGYCPFVYLFELLMSIKSFIALKGNSFGLPIQSDVFYTLYEISSSIILFLNVYFMLLSQFTSGPFTQLFNTCKHKMIVKFLVHQIQLFWINLSA